MDSTRKYRQQSSVMGQTSPPLIGPPALSRVIGTDVADVGCGSGLFGYMMRAAWQWTASWQETSQPTPARLVGVDWSPSTVKFLREYGPYDDVFLADSATIPLPDKSVDTALSMENLEHLLPGQVGHALAELVRIARQRIVITTPAPWAVVNVSWLHQEIAEAEADQVPLGYDEAMNLIGQVHKSSVTPEQMEAAGFDAGRNRLGAPNVIKYAGTILYTADPERVRPDRLGDVVGVQWDEYPTDDGRLDWNSVYVECLRASLAMPVDRRSRAARRRKVTLAAQALREFRHVD